jgi:hypothetical protein
VGEAEVDPEAMHGELVAIEKFIEAIKHKHNSFFERAWVESATLPWVGLAHRILLYGSQNFYINQRLTVL